jgi:TonB family protein
MSKYVVAMTTAIGLLLALGISQLPAQSSQADPQEKVYRVGQDGVSAPRLIHKAVPEYTDEARKENIRGTVVLSVVVGPDDRAHNIVVQRGLGFGLDEKAIECVQEWRFEPGRKDGEPVPVKATIEMNFPPADPESRRL